MGNLVITLSVTTLLAVPALAFADRPAGASNIISIFRLGSTGDEVKNLQEVLKSDTAIYPEGRVTGYFGQLTEAAVKRFQVKYSIVSSGQANTTGYGQVGPKTNAMLKKIFGGISSRVFPNSTATATPADPLQNPFFAAPTPSPVDCAKEPNGLAQDACWQSKAVSEKNATLCETIKGDNPFVSRDACLNLIAQSVKNPSLCASIKNPALEENCTNVIK